MRSGGDVFTRRPVLRTADWCAVAFRTVLPRRAPVTHERVRMTPDEYCQQKAAASGSSFYYSFLFLPPERRRAITALYAFCREVDDVVDEVHDTGCRADQARVVAAGNRARVRGHARASGGQGAAFRSCAASRCRTSTSRR